MEILKVAIYARVSDDKLKDDGERRQDVMRQVDLLKAYVDGFLNSPAGSKFTMGTVYIDDGKSAFKDDYQSRPAFCRLLKDTRANQVHRVYVESLDRWSRRVVDGLTTLQQVSENGMTVVSIAEGEVDWTHPQGWFKSLISLGMAEWASREKSWKVKQAMGRRAEDSRKACKSCSERLGLEIIHMGRHPEICECLKCRAKKARAQKKG